jgi:nucleoside-diphosphate-sugar epimerase
VIAVVTGAAGFVGRALVTELLRQGRHVIGIDRRPMDQRPGLLVLTADLLDRDELVTAALSAADEVFHLAGVPGVRDTGPDVEARRLRDNVLATGRVLTGVPAHVPLVVTSSSSVYGGARGRASGESDRLAPRGGYARSKLAVEVLCQDRVKAGGTVAVARPFTIVGEGQRPDMAMSRWLLAARTGRPLTIYGSLDRTRDLTDVREAARALVALADNRVTGPVNVGSGAPRTLAEMVGVVADVVGAPVELRVATASSVEASDTWADTRRLRDTVGFVPVTDLAAVVARQAAADLAATPMRAPA